MNLLLNEKSQSLLNLLQSIPPKMEDAENLIKTQTFTEEELTRVAINYAEDCRYDVSDTFDWYTPGKNRPKNSLGIIEGLQSSFLYEVLKLLLSYGMNPNAVLKPEGDGHYNVMTSVMWVENGYVAADSMRLLLENGGDPNLIVEYESVYDELTFDIFYGMVEQEDRWRYKSWVHTWFVLLAFREFDDDGRIFPEYYTDEMFDLRKLKDHRNYAFCLSKNKDETIRIFDKETFWEVACF